MDFEDAEDTGPLVERDDSSMADGGVENLPAAADGGPSAEQNEAATGAGSSTEAEPEGAQPADLIPQSEDGGEDGGQDDMGSPAGSAGNKSSWIPWVIVIVLVAAVIVVIALTRGGPSNGEAAATPTSQPAQPYIQISQPAQGAVLDIGSPVLVSGMAGALFEGNVVVQARDAGGNVLVEQPTTIQSPDAGTGGEGPWSLQISIPVQPGTPGEIVAFSTSPADGSITASAQVAVTFGQPVQAYIQITQPLQGAVLDTSSPVLVSGIGGGLIEGNVVVQARDAAGNVLTEQPTTIQAPDAGTGGEGPWSVQISIQAQPGSPGQIVAFSSSPADGSLTASAQVDVTYGQPVQAYIQINQPAAGAVLDISSPVLVSGTGGGLFEGNVVVQARDSAGSVLTEQPATIQSPDAGAGGEGPWAVQLDVQAQPGAAGQIVAFSPSPADGSIMASAQVEVTFGQAEEPGTRVNLEDHLWLLATLAGQGVAPGTQLTAQFGDGQVTGSAGCNQYNAPYQTSDSSLTVGQAATTRMACSEPPGIMEQESQYLNVLASAASYSIETGQLNILDANGQVVLAYNAAVIGQVNTASPTEMPENALATITLSDVSRADAPAVVIAEQSISNPSAFPFPFAVVYNAQDIDPRMTYGITVRISQEAGSLLMINTSAYNVITRDNPSIVEVVVEPVQ